MKFFGGFCCCWAVMVVELRCGWFDCFWRFLCSSGLVRLAHFQLVDFWNGRLVIKWVSLGDSDGWGAAVLTLFAWAGASVLSVEWRICQKAAIEKHSRIDLPRGSFQSTLIKIVDHEAVIYHNDPPQRSRQIFFRRNFSENKTPNEMYLIPIFIDY